MQPSWQQVAPKHYMQLHFCFVFVTSLATRSSNHSFGNIVSSM